MFLRYDVACRLFNFFNYAIGPSIQSASLKTSITPKEIVEAIYKSCNPSKVSEISKLLEKYKGKEDDLIRKLESKYNVKSSDFFGVKSTGFV